MDPLAALLGGVVAGLAVAIPLGPIGVLIIDRGMRAGLRTGLAAGAGAASVDLGYAVVAVTAGAGLASAIEAVQGPATVVAAVVLGGLGVVSVREAVRRPRAPTGVTVEPPPPTLGPWRTYALFVGLTSLNPATVLTFAAIVVGASDLLTGPSTRVAFVLGIAASSLGWQSLLAAAGAALGRRPRPGVQRLTRFVGGALLLTLATLLLVDTLR